MKRIFIALTFSVFLTLSGIAQELIVSGIIQDENGEPVFAANIYLKENPGKGVISGYDGEFTFTIQSKETEYTLVISYIGFITQEIAITSIADPSRLVITLAEDQKLLENIVVYARDPIAEFFSVEKLEKLDIYKEPASKGDPLKAITVLPASTTTDESANPSLRGSDGSRSRVFLNGVPIYEPVRFSQINGIGYFSVLNPEIIDEQYVYASNPPVSLGNSSAGLVQVNTIPSLPNNQIQLSTGLASSGVFISQRINESTFFQLYGNNQFSTAFLDLNGSNVADLNRFGTQDIGLNLNIELSKYWKMNFFSYGIQENFSVQTQIFTHNDDAEASTERNFSILNLEFRKGQYRWRLNSSYDLRSEKFVFGNLDSNNDRTTLYHAINYQFSFGNSSIESGLNHNYNEVQINDKVARYYYANAPQSPTETVLESPLRASLEAYIYSTWKINSTFVFTSGYRANWLYNNTKTYLSRQAALRIYLTEEHAFLISGGRYHNYSTPNSFTPDYTLQGSNQFAIDYSYALEMSSFEAAFFYKLEDEQATFQSDNPAEKVQTIGLEVSYTKRFGEWVRLFVANTFLDQEVQFADLTYSGTRDLNYFIKSSLSFDKTAAFSASLTFVSRPGIRFSSINGGEFDAETNFYIPSFSSSFNDQRYASYHNLSFSVSKYIPVATNALVAYVSASNFLDIQNEQSRRYSRDYSSYTFDTFEQRTFYFGLVWMWNR